MPRAHFTYLPDRDSNPAARGTIPLDTVLSGFGSEPALVLSTSSTPGQRRSRNLEFQLRDRCDPAGDVPSLHSEYPE